MYRAGVSFAQSGEYLSFLVRLGLIEVAPKRGKPVYKTTSKGIRYIESYEELRRLLQQNTKHNVTSLSSSFSSL
jgi:predicted transcriptional regulator